MKPQKRGRSQIIAKLDFKARLKDDYFLIRRTSISTADVLQVQLYIALLPRRHDTIDWPSGSKEKSDAPPTGPAAGAFAVAFAAGGGSCSTRSPEASLQLAMTKRPGCTHDSSVTPPPPGAGAPSRKVACNLEHGVALGSCMMRSGWSDARSAISSSRIVSSTSHM